MDVELAEVRAFLAAHEPFSALPGTILDELPSRLVVRYHRRGSVLMELGRPNNVLHVLRSGAVDIVDAQGALVERTEPGGSFGASSLLSRAPSRYTITAIEDSLVLVMDAVVFHHLVDHHEAVRTYYDQLAQQRLHAAVAVQQGAEETSAAWLRTRVGSLSAVAPISCPSTATVREAAQLMTSRRVSALLVVDEGALVGILTDRDLRAKVVAAGLDAQQPVSRVMTPDPVQVGPDSQAFEALLEMTTRGVHHLPVVSQGAVVGIISSGDVARLQQADPVFLVGDIARQQDVASLARSSRRCADLVAQLLRQDASADDITRLLSTVADALARRLVALATAELGGAPGAWAWITLGSQARRELSLGSDQDHALVMSDELVGDPDAQRWFAAVAQYVTDGLEQCGHPLCPGDVMATNPAWRLGVSQWRAQFAHWMNQPDPEGVLRSQIFFDARTVVGDAGLLAEVRADALQIAPRSQRFLGHLAAQATQRQTPLGFFRHLALGRRGEEQDSFDVKANGVHAVIEIARVHALAHGLDAVGTAERLRLLAGLGAGDSLLELADAFAFLSHVRLAHQSSQLGAGLLADNVVRPDELTAFERRHLKDAFALVRRAQEALAYSYQTHLMG